MAADNKVRVTFEAYTDQLQNRVREAVDSFTGLGTAGENAGKKLDITFFGFTSFHVKPRFG